MRVRITGLLAGAVSGLVGAIAYPPADLWFLAWVALVPLFLRVRATDGRKTVFPFIAFALVHFSTVLYWLSPVITPIGVIILAALIWLVFFLPMSLVIGFLVRRGTPLTIVAPLAWVAFDWLRTWLFSGFPWLFLAHSQADRTALIQVSDVTGASGVTALIVLVNAALAALVIEFRKGTPRRALAPVVAAAACLFLVLGYGAVRIGTIESREGPGILLVQACIAQGEKREVRTGESSGVDLADVILARHLRLTRDGVREHPDTAVVIWPETMFPRRIDDSMDASSWQSRGVNDRVRAIAASASTANPDVRRPAIFGALYTTSTGESRNSVFATDGEGRRVGRYDKRHTVPGGEHVPLHSYAPVAFTRWVGETIAGFSGYYPDLTEGPGPTILEVAGVRFTPLVCYEIIYPELVRETMSLDPQVILNLSNYAWYPDTHQPEQAEDITIFRAVENRRPVVVSANNGISSIIDARGKVTTSLGRDVEGALFGHIPLCENSAIYARWGDIFSWLAVATVALLGVGAVYSNRRGGQKSREPT